jgi:dihydroflavonol-4-reductase
LVRTLLEQRQAVRILVRSRSKAQALFGALADRLDMVEGDLGNDGSLRRAVEGVACVYHLASRISFQAPAAEMRAVNVEGTRRLMEACRQAGVRRVVHMSSIAAGGPAVRESSGALRPRTEADPPAPLADPYGQTKWEQEKLVLSYPSPEVVVVRPSAVFGPGDPDGINTLIRLVRDRSLPFYLGSSQAVNNLVFVRDVVRGTIAAMEKGRPGEIYHLVGANLTQEQLLGLIAQVSGGKAPRWALPVPVLLGVAHLLAVGSRLIGRRRSPVHPNEVRNWTAPWIMSDEKARRELGLVPTDLAAALRETLAWLDQQRPRRSESGTGTID